MECLRQCFIRILFQLLCSALAICERESRTWDQAAARGKRYPLHNHVHPPPPPKKKDRAKVWDLMPGGQSKDSAILMVSNNRLLRKSSIISDRVPHVNLPGLVIWGSCNSWPRSEKRRNKTEQAGTVEEY